MGSAPIFDQRGQHVTYQYNSAGNINFGAVQNGVDLVGELQKLKAELANAVKAGVVDQDTATDADYQLTKAAQQAQKPAPEKQSLLKHLTEAKALVAGVTALSGMVTGLGQALEMAQHLF